MTSKQRAWAALTQALRDTLPAQRVQAFVGGTHTASLADNLLPGLSNDEVELVRAQLGEGDGGELVPTASGKVRAHAPYSSAALAANAFGRWLTDPQHLQLAGLASLEQVRLEDKLKINHGGGTANLDLGAYGPDLIFGVESKLTEMLDPHEPEPWRKPYLAPAMRDLLSDGWADVFDQSLAGTWTPQHLGLEQLIKHALAITSQAGARKPHLLYLYWEPRNGFEIPEVRAHREEVKELQETVGEASPRLYTLTYRDLFDQWAAQPEPVWLLEHASQLRERYEIEI